MPSIASELSVLRGQWTVAETYYQLPNSSALLQIAQANPLRWSIRFTSPGLVNDGTNSFLITTQGITKTNVGMPANLQNPWIAFNYRQDGALAQMPFWAFTPSGSNVFIQVIEVTTVSGNF